MQKYILLIGLLCSLLAGCSTEYSAVYQSVKAESKWDESARIIINNTKHELPSYKVKENTLYLMIQMTQVDWFFHTVINYPVWGKAEMSKLFEKQGDIKSLVPVDWNNWLPKGYGDECKGK
jgi:hypothetical protein